MDILLLAGYRASPMGLETDEAGNHWIDGQIWKLTQLGLSPIVVLAGDQADQVIRKSRFLPECELVYDTSGASANLLSNVRAGLRATEAACFVMPVEITVPPKLHWTHLKAQLIREGLFTRFHAFQIGEKGAPWHYGFPLLLSVTGRKAFLEVENPAGLSDPRFAYHFSRHALALPTQSL